MVGRRSSARWHRALGLALLLASSACSYLPKIKQAGIPVEEIRTFDLAGRISVTREGRNLPGKLYWHHDDLSDQIEVLTPLGQGVARIVRDADGVTLTTADKKEYRASDAEALTEQRLGWRLPLSSLPDWVLGRPARAPVDEMARDEEKRLISLTQLGWKIEYPAYREGDVLPQTIRLSRPEIDLRIAVDSWAVGR